MLARFATQRAAVREFTSPVEKFRRGAPSDSLRPPCSGPLGYGRTGSGLESTIWRNLMASSVRAGQASLPRHLHFQVLRTLMCLLIVASEVRLRHCAAASRIERVFKRFLPAQLSDLRDPIARTPRSPASLLPR